MVQTQILVNKTKKEYITFASSKQREIIGSRILSDLALTFIFENQGDLILFIASDWQTAVVMLSQDMVYEAYKDVTAEYIYHLIEGGDWDEVPEDYRDYFKRPEKCRSCGSTDIGQLDERFSAFPADDEAYQKAGGRYYCMGCGAALTVP